MGIFLTSAGELAAQERPALLLSDDFNGPSSLFTTRTSDGATTSLQDGRLFISVAGSTTSWATWTSHYLSHRLPLSITLTFRRTSNNPTSVVGIQSGPANSASTICVGLRADGRMAIVRGPFVLGTTLYLSDPIPGADRIDVDHTLELRVNGDSTSILVNGRAIHSTRKRTIRGMDMGIWVRGAQQTRIDRFAVYQDLEAFAVDTTVPLDLRVERIDAISTDRTEKGPVVSPDGSTLYFVRTIDRNNEDDDEIFTASADSSTLWKGASNPGSPLNTPGGNFVAAVAPDGQWLLLGNRYDGRGRVSGAGFSMAYRTDTGWTQPVPLDIEDFSSNSKYMEATMSADAQHIIMTLDRADALGERDMYVCHRRPDGTWTSPMWMGNVINTIGDEISPSLAGDNQTIYFASTGRPGFGRSDIFVSRRRDSTWTSWTEPINLGAGINTPDWEAYFSMPVLGAWGVMVRQQVGGDHDILAVRLPEALRPKPTTILRGTIRSYDGLPIPGAMITLQGDGDNGPATTAAISDPTSGSYRMVLPTGTTLRMAITAEGHWPEETTVDPPSATTSTVLTRDVVLRPLQRGQPIPLSAITFATGSAEIPASAATTLDRIASAVRPFLVGPTAGRLVVSGHTDNTGTEAANLALSNRRAEAVGRALADRGIPAHRITTAGHASRHPIASNTTASGRQQNRRVEVVVE